MLSNNSPSPGTHSGTLAMSSPVTPPINSHRNVQQRRVRATRFPLPVKSNPPPSRYQQHNITTETPPPQSCPVQSAYFPILPPSSPTPPNPTATPLPTSSEPARTPPEESHRYQEPISFHQVEPRNLVPRPFTMEGYSLPANTATLPLHDHSTTFQQYTTPTRTHYVMSHDPNELEFPTTLDILWDRSPLRTPIIIPHERLLPSLWVSRQTMLSLSQSVAHSDSQDGQRNARQGSDLPIGLLVGRASFPGRSGHNRSRGQSSQLPPTFVADARPVVCLDLFDSGRQLCNVDSHVDDEVAHEQKTPNTPTTVLVPSNDSLLKASNVMMIPVKRHGEGGDRSSAAAAAAAATLATPRETVEEHIVDLADACSNGTIRQAQRISRTAGRTVPKDVLDVPGSGLWSIRCTVGNSTTNAVTTAIPVRFSVVMPALSLGFTMIQSLPLVTSPMTSSLLHGTGSTGRTGGTTGEFQHGLLTLNQVRRAVPLLSDDPLTKRVPMVGAWIQMPLNTFQEGGTRPSPYEATSPSLQRVLTDPAVWSTCCRYLYDPTLTRATQGAQPTYFLLAVFPTDSPRPSAPRNPLFFEVSVVNDGNAGNSDHVKTINGRPSMPVAMYGFSTTFRGAAVGHGSERTEGKEGVEGKEEVEEVEGKDGRKQQVNGNAFQSSMVTDTMVSCRFRPVANPHEYIDFSKAVDGCAAKILQGELMRKSNDSSWKNVGGRRNQVQRTNTCTVRTVRLEKSSFAARTTPSKQEDVKSAPDYSGRRIFSEHMMDGGAAGGAASGAVGVEGKQNTTAVMEEEEYQELSGWKNGEAEEEADEVIDMLGEEEDVAEAQRSRPLPQHLRESTDSRPPLWRGDIRGSRASSTRASFRSSFRSSLRSSLGSSIDSFGSGAEEEQRGDERQTYQEGGIQVHEVIASQQLQIQMLQAQVEALGLKLTQQMDIVRTAANPQRIESFSVSSTSSSTASSTSPTTGMRRCEQKTENDAVQEDKEILCVDRTPVNPALRLSIPSFQSKEDEAKQYVDGEGSDDEDELFEHVVEKPSIPLYDVDVPRIQYDENEEEDDESDDSYYTDRNRRYQRRLENDVEEDQQRPDAYSEYDSMMSTADISSFQEGPTMARIEAKYLLKGERSAALCGQRFVPKNSYSMREEEVDGNEFGAMGRTTTSVKGHTTSPVKHMMLDRGKLLDRPKFV